MGQSGKSIKKDKKKDKQPDVQAEVTRLQAMADRARQGYEHEEAVALYSQALDLIRDGEISDPELEYALLDGRAYSLELMAELRASLADRQAMAGVAENHLDDPAYLIEALIAQWGVHGSLGDVDQSRAVLDRALTLARDAGDIALQVDSLLGLVFLAVARAEIDEAQRLVEEAERKGREIDDMTRRASTLGAKARVLNQSGKSEQAIAEYREALALYRYLGQPFSEAHVLHGLGASGPDIGQKLEYQHQALALYRDVGARFNQVNVQNNMTYAYLLLGLFHRAISLGEEAIAIARPAQLRFILTFLSGNLAHAYLSQGQFEAAGAQLAEYIALAQETGQARLEQEAFMALGRLSFMRGAYAEAELKLGEVATQMGESDAPDLASTLAWQGASNLALGKRDEARQLTQLAAEQRSADPDRDQEFPTQEIGWWRYLALAAPRLPEAGRAVLSGPEDDEAWQALDQARGEMLSTIDSLDDNGLRRNYFNKIAVNRWLIPTWLAEARARKHDLAELTDQLTRSGNIQPQLRRLLDIGVRMNARGERSETPDDLAAFILDELVELSGADRAAVVLAVGEERRLAAWSLPLATTPYLRFEEKQDDEAAGEALLAEIESLLDETGLNHQGVLRHTPKEAAELEQTSILCLPLVTHNKVVGWLYADLPGIYGRFNLDDLELLNVLANQAAVAVENASWSRELEGRVEERTVELSAANQILEDRTAELAIINSVQSALVAELDIQGIYDAVGDKLAEIFDAQAVTIYTYDEAGNQIHCRYALEKGERFYPEPSELGELERNLIVQPQVLLFNENATEGLARLGVEVIPGTEPTKSAIYAPLLSVKRVFGNISLQNVDREHAFSESDVRLLTTLANSMSVALENARLFDEIQKKNAEISEALERETASNDILRAIAESPTDIQPVLDVIAQHAAQLSGSDDAIIAVKDGEMLRVTAHYGDIPMIPVGEGIHFDRDSVAGRAMIEGRSLQAILNQPGVKSEYPEGDKVAQKYGYHLTGAVPLMREGKAVGVITIRSTKSELLNDNQIELLQSFANQAAIAVENVRLFNETTRLLAETEQRASELAIINRVQSRLASRLESQAIVERVGDNLREILGADRLGIRIRTESVLRLNHRSRLA
jgi:transcriptional regulator with GAF, ATPase, and Fis domain